MEQTGAPSEKQVEWEDGEYYELSVNIGKSQRYHSFMCDFYSRGHDFSLAATAITGSSAFVALLPEGSNTAGLWLPKLLTAIVAISTTLDLVFNPAKKADVHSSLHRRFVKLAAVLRQSDATPENYKAVYAKRLDIEADEPPVRRLINIRAQNDECRSRGVPINRLVPLDFWQSSWLAYVFTFGLRGLQQRLSDRSP